MRTTWSFHTAGQLLFGRNATQHLGEVVIGLNLRRLLLVTDPTLVRAGLVDPVLGPLSEAGVTVSATYNFPTTLLRLWRVESIALHARSDARPQI